MCVVCAGLDCLVPKILISTIIITITMIVIIIIITCLSILNVYPCQAADQIYLAFVLSSTKTAFVVVVFLQRDYLFPFATPSI